MCCPPVGQKPLSYPFIPVLTIITKLNNLLLVKEHQIKRI